MANDQAEKLRLRILQGKNEEHCAQIVGIASGKGGVGKSVFCVNFSLALNEIGKKVLIIDLDVGMGNIEQLMGKPAQLNIVDAIVNEVNFQNALVNVSSNVSFIAGGTGLSSLFHLDHDYLHFFIEQLNLMKKDYDFIIFDFGAGASDDMLHFMLAVNRLILITTPEPPAMADSYSLIKMVYAMKKNLDISCVVNQTFGRKEGWATWQRLSSVSERFLGASPSWLASLHRDNDLLMSVRKQIPCILSCPQAKYSVEMRILARAFLAQCGEQVAIRHQSSFGDKVRKYLKLIRRDER